MQQGTSGKPAARHSMQPWSAAAGRAQLSWLPALSWLRDAMSQRAAAQQAARCSACAVKGPRPAFEVPNKRTFVFLSGV